MKLAVPILTLVAGAACAVTTETRMVTVANVNTHQIDVVSTIAVSHSPVSITISTSLVTTTQTASSAVKTMPTSTTTPPPITAVPFYLPRWFNKSQSLIAAMTECNGLDAFSSGFNHRRLCNYFNCMTYAAGGPDDGKCSTTTLTETATTCTTDQKAKTMTTCREGTRTPVVRYVPDPFNCPTWSAAKWGNIPACSNRTSCQERCKRFSEFDIPKGLSLVPIYAAAGIIAALIGLSCCCLCLFRKRHSPFNRREEPKIEQNPNVSNVLPMADAGRTAPVDPVTNQVEQVQSVPDTQTIPASGVVERVESVHERVVSTPESQTPSVFERVESVPANGGDPTPSLIERVETAANSTGEQAASGSEPSAGPGLVQRVTIIPPA